MLCASLAGPDITPFPERYASRALPFFAWEALAAHVDRFILKKGPINVKALITTLFLCLCALPADASSLMCIPSPSASNEFLPMHCDSGDPSFVNTPSPDPVDRDAQDPAAILNIMGPLFMPMSFQVMITVGPLTDSQMKSSFGNAAVETDAAMQLPTSPAVTSAVSAPVGVDPSNPPAPQTGPSTLADLTSQAPVTAAAAVPETGSIAMIGSGLIFLSLVASSTRKRRRQRG
jgi:hypothetical protein